MQTKANDRTAFWKQKLQEYRKSGLSRRTFSEQIGVGPSEYEGFLQTDGYEGYTATGSQAGITHAVRFPLQPYWVKQRTMP